MTRIAVCGVAGRMGQRLVHLIVESADLQLAGGTEFSGHEAVGRDMGDVVASAKGLDIPAVTADLNDVVGSADVATAFTTPEATVRDAEICARHETAMVVGTTGPRRYPAADVQVGRRGDSLCIRPPISATAMNVLFKLVEEAARDSGRRLRRRSVGSAPPLQG